MKDTHTHIDAHIVLQTYTHRIRTCIHAPLGACTGGPGPGPCTKSGRGLATAMNLFKEGLSGMSHVHPKC